MIVQPSFFSSDEWNNKRNSWLDEKEVIMVTGHFSPFRWGHLSHIVEASNICQECPRLVTVIVNGDNFLRRKNLHCGMSQEERAYLVDNIKGVDYTMIWDDGTDYVHGAIELVRPTVFACGGSLSLPKIERDACKSCKCRVKNQVGLNIPC